MYVTLSTSWALFCGRTRYLSLATSAFFGIGAYAGALRCPTAGWVAAIALGAALAAAVAVAMGAAVLHLRGTYFAVLTFGMTELIRHAVDVLREERHRHGGPRAHRRARARHHLPHHAGARGAGDGPRRSPCAARASAARCWASAPTSSARRRSASTRGA
jgi:branched-subunit amino acid ABC-type transport system permease component